MNADFLASAYDLQASPKRAEIVAASIHRAARVCHGIETVDPGAVASGIAHAAQVERFLLSNLARPPRAATLYHVDLIRAGELIWSDDFANLVVIAGLNKLLDACFVTGLSARGLWAVKTDGQGDITDTGVAWKFKTHVGIYASPLLVDGLIYDAAEESYVTCLDAATGQLVWTDRIAGKYAASPVYADGRLYFFNEQGTTTVLKPGRAFEVLATNTLADGFMASPAVSGRALFLRTRTHLYRIEE